MSFRSVPFRKWLPRAILALLLVSLVIVQVTGPDVRGEETSMSQTLYWHRTKHECEHYVLDTSLPLEGKVSAMVSLRPEDYMIIGHPIFYRIHTNPVPEDTVIEMGYWTLTMWASNRKAEQHFLVSLYAWDSEHERVWSSEEWNTGVFMTVGPDKPVELTHTFYAGSLTIPKGGFFGFVIKGGTDSAINYFFDSTLHDSKLVVPASRPLLPGYELVTVTYTATSIIPILTTQTETTKTTTTQTTTQSVTVQTTMLKTTEQTRTIWAETTETVFLTSTSMAAIGIGIAIAAVGIIAALLTRRRPRETPPARPPSELF